MPGTCGELVQGTWEGIPCLVSCPIECYSVAEVRSGGHSGWQLQPNSPKMRAALQHGLTYMDQTTSSGRISVCSPLPQGRGYGSSTADIGATLYALGHAFGQPLTPLEISALALQVEPTDSSLFPDLTLWDHRHGQLYETLGQPPALTVVVLDPGGEVNTVAFNRLDHRTALQKLAPLHRDAFQLLQDGLRQGDVAAIGAAATMSAEAHQAILPNALLAPAVHLAREVGALGVCRAHSGTVVGLLLDPNRTDPDLVQNVAQQRLPEHIHMFNLPLVAGGPRLLPAQGLEPQTLCASTQLQ
jgi:L-threonine kinase